MNHFRSFSEQQPPLTSNGNNNIGGSNNNNIGGSTNNLVELPNGDRAEIVHSDSQQSLDRLFSLSQTSVPLRNRNLPASFFNPAWQANKLDGTHNNNNNNNNNNNTSTTAPTSLHMRSTSCGVHGGQANWQRNIHMRTQSTLAPMTGLGSTANSNNTSSSSIQPTTHQNHHHHQHSLQLHPNTHQLVQQQNLQTGRYQAYENNQQISYSNGAASNGSGGSTSGSNPHLAPIHSPTLPLHQPNSLQQQQQQQQQHQVVQQQQNGQAARYQAYENHQLTYSNGNGSTSGSNPHLAPIHSPTLQPQPNSQHLHHHHHHQQHQVVQQPPQQQPQQNGQAVRYQAYGGNHQIVYSNGNGSGGSGSSASGSDQQLAPIHSPTNSQLHPNSQQQQHQVVQQQQDVHSALYPAAYENHQMPYSYY